MREADEAQDTAKQRPLPRPDIRTSETRGTTWACYAHLDTHIDAHLHSTVEDPVEPGPFSQIQGILHGLETDTHTIETVIRNLLIRPSHHHVAQSMGLRILQNITPRGKRVRTDT